MWWYSVDVVSIADGFVRLTLEWWLIGDVYSALIVMPAIKRPGVFR